MKRTVKGKKRVKKVAMEGEDDGKEKQEEEGIR